VAWIDELAVVAAELLGELLAAETPGTRRGREQALDELA